MKKLAYTVLLVICPLLSFAEDGLVVQFTIEEASDDGQERASYTDAILMPFAGEHRFEVRDLYVIKFKPTLIEGRLISLVTTLKDIDDGKPYYVGAEAIDLEVGGSEAMSMENNGSSYTIKVDTSYGKLP